MNGNRLHELYANLQKRLASDLDAARNANKNPNANPNRGPVDVHAVAVVMMATEIDPADLRIVVDELTSALISAVALGAHAMGGTSTEAAALDAAIRRATATLRGLQLGVTARSRR